MAPGGHAPAFVQPAPGWLNPLWPALLLAVLIHVLLILAWGFKPIQTPPAVSRTLDILVLPPSAPAALTSAAEGATQPPDEPPPITPRMEEQPIGTAPRDPSPATLIASVTPAAAPAESSPPPSMPEQPRGGAAATEAQNPEEAPVSDPLPPLPPLARVQTDTAEVRQPLPEPGPVEQVRQLVPLPKGSVADILASRGEEIAKLSAKIAAETSAHANRPRRKSISASTQEYHYASYLEAWRRKVEAVGNLNYPEEAKRRQLYGNLILRVGVRADGSLEEVLVLRSSGSPILDDAAVRIVHLAAPFAPFPPDIRRETDLLDITRTWQFLSNNRFGDKP